MENSTLNLNDIITIVQRRIWYIIGPFIAVTVLAVVIAFLIPPKFRSTSTILIEEQEIPREYVNASITSYADQRLQSINQKIIGTTKLLEIIKKFNLYSDLKEKKTAEEIVEKMRKDIKFQTIDADVRDPRTGRAGQATIAFTVAYIGRNPSLVQNVANELASLYLAENLQTRQRQSVGTANFLEEEMKSVQTELALIDGKIAIFKQNNLNSLPELSQLNLQTLDNLDRDVRQTTEQMKSLREKESYLQSELDSMPTDSANQDKSRLNELRTKLIDLENRFSDKHPDVIKTKSEIAGVTKQLRAANRETTDSKPDNPAYISLQSQLASVKSDLASVKRQLNDYSMKREDFRKRLEASPRVEEGYKGLISLRQNLQLKNEDLSRKYMEARVANGLEKEQMGERFTLIDAARFPEKPVSPNIPVIILIGIVLGLAAGCGVAALKEMGDSAVRSIDDLSQISNVAVLGVIPEIVTTFDKRRIIRKRRMILISTALSLVSVVLIFHFFIMDLDIFWIKLAKKLDL